MYMPLSPQSPDTTPRTLAAAGLPKRVRGVLEHALTLVSEELDHGLHTLLDEFEQELFRLADLARNPGSESGYMQILRTFRMHRADFVPHFMLEMEAAVASVRQPAGATASAASAAAPFPTLSLVEDATLDEDSVLRDIALRQEGRANLSLHLLGQRFGVLWGTPALDSARVPLGPQSVCRALRNASHALQIDHDARLLLYRLFDRHVMTGMARLLEKLDRLIADDGILPGLTYVPLRIRPTPQNDDASARSAPNAREQRGKTRAPPPFAPRDRVSSDPVLHARRRGNDRARRAASEAIRPHTAWMGEASAEDDYHEGAGSEAEAYEVLQQLMAGRRDLISKLRPAPAPRSQAELDQADLDRALAALQPEPHLPMGTPRNLTDIKQTLLAQMRQQRGRHAAMTQQHDDTFELLHMLYGQIEGEISASAPAAALVRRLQLPLLRVALQDRSFFVRGDHPARQLLNTVAESAARWLGEEDFDPQLLVPLQAAVNHVVEHYAGDNQVFEDSNRKAQALMQAQARKAELLERRHIEAARGKEKLEIAKLGANEALRQLIGDHRLPRFTRALLNQAWADVLTLVLLRHGEDSDDWRSHLDATRQIIAVCGRGGRNADTGLTSLVEAALNQVGYHGEETSVIAQRLTSSPEDDENDPASRTELAMKVKARVRLGEEAARTVKPKLPPRTPDEQLNYEQLRILPYGAWIEFVTNQQGDVVRRRLSWYSPVTDNALFVNQRGQRVGEHSLDSVARMLAHGQARIVSADRGHIVDRAWQGAINALRSFASRGDSTAADGQPA
ncbi:MAG: DUF1631 domain-containing protein [Pseudomonadota bacterium]|nr:DUF1631 domain-containing protein [Pseudomonadota bacterium]